MNNSVYKIKLLWIVNDLFINNFVTVYRECQQNGMFDFIVLAAPHLDQNPSYCITTDQVYDYITNEGIPCINSWDESSKSYIDIATLEPDYIFTTTPYDLYLPEPYQSENLMRIAKLCHVSYGAKIIEWSGVYSDMTNNPFYQNTWKVFTEASESEDGAPFQSIPIGYLKLDDYLNYKRNCNEASWWHKTNSDSIRPLKVVWKPRWTLMESDSNLFKYIENFYDFIKNNNRIDFILLFHPLLLSRIDQSESGEYFHQCLGQMEKLDNFKAISDSNFLDCVLSADVLVADHSSTIAEFAITGRPIIYTTTEARLNRLGQEILKYSCKADSFGQIAESLNTLIESIGGIPSELTYHQKSYFFIPPDGKTIAKYLLEFLHDDCFNIDSRKMYERKLYLVAKEAEKRFALQATAARQQIVALESRIDRLGEELSSSKKQLTESHDLLAESQKLLADSLAAQRLITGSFSWRATKLLRVIRSKIKKSPRES